MDQGGYTVLVDQLRVAAVHRGLGCTQKGRHQGHADAPAIRSTIQLCSTGLAPCTRLRTTPALSPGGLEHFTSSVDAIAQEIMYRNVDLDSMEMFLTAGVGDLSFELSD